jgi:hypothetical protein
MLENLSLFLTTNIEDIINDDGSTSPRIGFLAKTNQYVIITEKKLLLEPSCIKDALFFLFASYYVYNLEYPQPVKNVLHFFQDFILKHPDSNDRNSTYLSVTSDIKQLL